MRVRLVFLGRLQDLAGDCGAVELAPDASIGAAIAALPPTLQAELLTPRVRIALNGALAGHDAKLGDGDELAFLPPVSGG
jgi:molybdopterin synthase sulfur carrier subunit